MSPPISCHGFPHSTHYCLRNGEETTDQRKLRRFFAFSRICQNVEHSLSLPINLSLSSNRSTISSEQNVGAAVDGCLRRSRFRHRRSSVRRRAVELRKPLPFSVTGVISMRGSHFLLRLLRGEEGSRFLH